MIISMISDKMTKIAQLLQDLRQLDRELPDNEESRPDPQTVQITGNLNCPWPVFWQGRARLTGTVVESKT